MGHEWKICSLSFINTLTLQYGSFSRMALASIRRRSRTLFFWPRSYRAFRRGISSLSTATISWGHTHIHTRYSLCQDQDLFSVVLRVLCSFSPCHISYKGHLSSDSTDMSAWIHEHKAEPSESPVCSKSRCGSLHCYDPSDGVLGGETAKKFKWNQDGYEYVSRSNAHSPSSFSFSNRVKVRFGCLRISSLAEASPTIPPPITATSNELHNIMVNIGHLIVHANFLCFYYLSSSNTQLKLMFNNTNILISLLNVG